MRSSVALRMTQEQVREVVAHCLAGRPNEACGLLLGRGGRVLRVHCLRNADHSPFSFLIEPEDQIRVIEEMERDKLELTAIYHSHPSSEARPSPRDVQRASWPEAFHLIVSLRGEPVQKVFRIVDGRVEEAPLIIEGSL